MTFGIVIEDPDFAREVLGEAIDYLGDVDGYSRADLQALVNDRIADLFQEESDDRQS